MPWSRKTHAVVGSVVLLLAATAFVAFGLAGVGRGTVLPFKDLDCFTEAGRSWLAGGSPYDLEAARSGANSERVRRDFPYPPQAGVLCIPLGGLPAPVARAAMAMINFLSVIALAVATMRLATNALEDRPGRAMVATRWFLPALVLASPFAAHAAYLAQSSLLIAAALAWGWYLASRGHPIPGGILLGVTTLKPHLAVLPFLWLLLERRWRVLCAVAATSFVCALPAFLIAGPVASVRGWLTAITHYQKFGPNSFGSEWTVGFPSLLASLGMAVPGPRFWLLVGVALVLLLWRVRGRICPDDALGLIVVLQCAFTLVHVYDLVLLAPLISSLWLHLAHRPVAWPWAVGWLGLLYLPQRIVRVAGSLPLQQWRVPVMLAAAAVVIAMGWRERPRGAQVPARTAGAGEG